MLKRDPSGGGKGKFFQEKMDGMCLLCSIILKKKNLSGLHNLPVQPIIVPHHLEAQET